MSRIVKVSGSVDKNGRVTPEHPREIADKAAANTHEADVTLYQAAAVEVSRADLIAAIATQMRHVTEAQIADVSMIRTTLSEGAWSRDRSNATTALFNLSPDDGQDEDLDDTARELYAERIAAYAHRVNDQPTEWYATLSAAEEAARALANRHLIGAVEGWDQDAYDTLTRAWSTVFGPVHPDDDISPESWAKRPLSTEEVQSLSPATLTRYTEVAQVKDPDRLVPSDLPLLLVEDRAYMAENSWKDSILDALAKDADADVRFAVAQNPETSVDTNDTLLSDEDEHVRDAARFSLDS